MNALYTAEALSTGHGREGRVSTSDETFSVTLAPPRELGGLGGGSNPKQLFAAGFAACFHTALDAVAHPNATRGNIDVVVLVSND